MSCVALSCGAPPARTDTSEPEPGVRPAATLGTTMLAGCYVDEVGRVLCFGRLGGRPSGTGMPRVMLLPRPALSIAVAQQDAEIFACALDKTGDVFCWGHGMRGQLGGDYGIFTLQPRRVSLERPARAIAAVQNRACALLDDGGVTCWGSVLPGPTDVMAIRLQDGRRLTRLVQIDVDVGLDAEGRIWVWGDDRCAEVRAEGEDAAEPRSAELYSRPAHVLHGRRAVQVTSHGYTNCALNDSGEVWCWGERDPGYIDQMACSDCTPVPWRIEGLPAVASVRCTTLACVALDRQGHAHWFIPSMAPEKVTALAGLEVVEAEVGMFGDPQGCARLAEEPDQLVCFGPFVDSKDELVRVPRRSRN